ncbi:hypothetical protein J8L88_21170 [Aquimarina sp. MMG015]|uniref:hypothetical protein n=1 Tax=Aquimarina sp. MMG015 TaxID=2822689 RepID=UPI001B39E09A|nr:hypothetical protein [Aquimarina sp. MMG015]MBQ4805386.1 hypothetical protein [Aquimarina sp. MMG015]
MKTFKIIILLFFSFVLGNQNSVAQKSDKSKSEQFIPDQVDSKSIKRANRTVNSSDKTSLYSEREKTARALTAKKSKNSGKPSLTSEEAKRRIESRVAEIKQENKTKRKKPLKRNKNKQ